MSSRLIKIIIVYFFVSLLSVTLCYSQNKYEKTPFDMEGPYYPVTKKTDEDNNLINVKGKSEVAKGDILNLRGIVTNTDGIPQKDTIIEIWQTDANGLYEHPNDRSKGKRDPYFQYWGRTKTDSQGEYNFKTLIPGKYGPRPSHIHFKVWVGDRVVLTSQMYIVENKINSSRINRLQKLQVTRNKEGEFSGFFRIVL